MRKLHASSPCCHKTQNLNPELFNILAAALFRLVYGLCVCGGLCGVSAGAIRGLCGGAMMEIYRSFVSAALRQGHSMKAAGELWKQSAIRRTMVEDMLESKRLKGRFVLDPEKMKQCMRRCCKSMAEKQCWLMYTVRPCQS